MFQRSVPPQPEVADYKTRLQSTIGDSYAIERELGGAGMSRVFVAHERALDRKVVVKVLSQELAGGLSADRFRREIQVAARLQHPNIVPLLAAGDADGIPYYTMPFVEGESLRARVQRTGELPVRDAVAVLRDVARALDYAHAHGVVHRDIKPDNVLVSEDYAVVTDFGVAKALIAARSGDDTLTQLGVAIGTPAYMAPEQGAGDTVDHRADIYAFGCLAFELLTGVPPFTAGNAQALFAAHAMKTPPEVAEVRNAVPRALSELVSACLAKRPADRPQSAREVIATLDAVATPAAGSVSAALAPRRRLSPGTLTLAAAVAVIAVVAAIVFGARRPGAAGIRESVVAVTPFRVAGADPSLRILREGMLDLVGAKLSGGLSSVDARTLLAAWRERGGGENRDLAQEEALALAGDLDAGRLLQGDVVGTPQRMVINATLLGVPGGRIRGSASVTGEQSQLAVLVDSLIAELFVQEAGGSLTQARLLAGTPLAALESYLAGQAHYRRGKYFDAETQFMHALDVDSTFAHAAIQLWLTSGWTASSNDDRGMRLALRRYAELTDRERVALEGRDPRWLSGYRPDCIDTENAAEQNVARFPDMPEAWYIIGERLFHCGWATTTGDDPWRRSLAAFERALALDSSFAPAKEHLSWLYAYAGDTLRAREVLKSMGDADYAVLMSYSQGFMPATERAAYVDSMTRTFSEFFAMVAEGAQLFGIEVDDGARILDRLHAAATSRREQATLGAIERRFALNAGQPARAAAAARVAATPAAVVLLDASLWDGDSSAAIEALPLASRAFTQPASAGVSAQWATDVFAVAQYHLAHGDSATVGRAISLLRSVAAPPGEPWLTDRPRRLALLLDAQLATLTRRADARVLLAAADSLMRLGPTGEYVLAAGALIVARLWEQHRDLRRAYASIKRRDFIPPLMYASTYVLERARIAAAMGMTRDAIEQYRLYLGMRQSAEVSRRAVVDNARRELARLEAAAR